MSIRSDHKALAFLGIVAVLGVGVRVVRAASGPHEQNVQSALQRQVQAADSAARAGRAKGRGGKAGRGKPPVLRVRAATGDTIAGREVAPLDRPGYIGKRLDLDVATAAQVDSLPGITPAIAKSIVAERLRRGPFLNLEGLRRVPGIRAKTIAQLDSLVTFSGTMRQGASADTLIPKSKRGSKRLAHRAPP